MPEAPPDTVLALDTALAACSAAVLFAGERPRRTVARSLAMPRGHAEALMPMLEALLAEARIGYADIGRIAVTVGPGTFTGVRVGVAAARGLALALDRPVVGVTTLAALAATARPRHAGPVVAAIDARRGEIYAQSFAADGQPLDDPCVAEAAAVAARLRLAGMGAIGSAARALARSAEAFGGSLPVLGEDAAPAPEAVARLGLLSDLRPSPLYLRPADAKPQHGAAIARR